VFFAGQFDASAPLLASRRPQPLTVTFDLSIAELPVIEINGVGPATATRLESVNVVTIGDLARLPPETAVANISLSVFKQIWNRASELASVTVKAGLFVDDSSSKLADLAEHTPQELSASSNRSIVDSEALLRSLATLEKHIDPVKFRKLTIGDLDRLRDESAS